MVYLRINYNNALITKYRNISSYRDILSIFIFVDIAQPYIQLYINGLQHYLTLKARTIIACICMSWLVHCKRVNSSLLNVHICELM